jgi:tetratricopeptide (TPR) repeat protein
MISFLTWQCTGSKSLSRKADKLQEAGLNEEAADFYYKSLQRNPRNVDAKIGLKHTGKEILESLLNEFYKSYSAEEHRMAVQKYREAKNFQDMCSPFVDLEIPSYYKDYYEESETTYKNDLYEKANELIYEEKYKDADRELKKIIDLDPTYKDAKELASMTTAEPMYRKGVKLFEAGKYRESYAMMKRVIDQKGSYKDAIDYRDNALEEATITIAVSPFDVSNNNQKRIAEKINGSITQSLVNSENPFIKVVDRSNTEKLLEEQRLNMELGTESRVQAGEMLGANMIITGKMMDYQVSSVPVHTSRQPAFERVKIQKVNPRTKEKYVATEYRKTYYNEYSGSRKVTAALQYQVINAETGEVVSGGVINETEMDNVNYATRKGGFKNLYPGEFSSSLGGLLKEGKVITSYQAKSQLQSKFTSSKRELRPVSQIRADLAQKIAHNIVSKVYEYNPEL